MKATKEEKNKEVDFKRDYDNLVNLIRIAREYANEEVKGEGKDGRRIQA